jgi:putative alpha-1,2-mannosidase
MRKLFQIAAVCSVLISCESKLKTNNTYVSYVDPFIGTGGHGHTFPGATMPFGMVQLSPDTRLDGWDGCSGYHRTIFIDQFAYS